MILFASLNLIISQWSVGLLHRQAFMREFQI